MLRVASRAAQVRLLFCGTAAPPLIDRGGPLTPPEGVLGPLLRPSWRLQSAAPLWSAPFPTPAAMRLSGSEVGAFYWTDSAPDIVNSRREEQGLVSL
jgi:hypothetical protein